MADVASTTSFPHFAVAMDITNTRHILVAWSAVDTASARLRAWHVDSGAITALTDVVSSSTDDQGNCAITLDTFNGNYWVYYTGSTNGAETVPTAVNLYCKCSKDGGTTWGPETKLSPNGTNARNMTCLYGLPRKLFPTADAPPVLVAHMLTWESVMINLDMGTPSARLQLGV